MKSSNNEIMLDAIQDTDVESLSEMTYENAQETFAFNAVLGALQKMGMCKDKAEFLAGKYSGHVSKRLVSCLGGRRLA